MVANGEAAWLPLLKEIGEAFDVASAAAKEPWWHGGRDLGLGFVGDGDSDSDETEEVPEEETEEEQERRDEAEIQAEADEVLRLLSISLLRTIDVLENQCADINKDAQELKAEWRVERMAKRKAEWIAAGRPDFLLHPRFITGSSDKRFYP